MIRVMLLSAFAWVVSAVPAVNPPDRYNEIRTPALRELCGTVREWKELMKRKYPRHDRYIPEMARICGMGDD